MKKNYLKNLIKIIIILVCFVFVFVNLDKDLVLKTLKSVNFNFILPSLIFFLVYLFFYGLFIFKIFNYLFPKD